MLNRRLATTTLSLLVAALALSACGSSKSESGSGGGASGGSGGGGGKTITLGVIAPLSGDLSQVGSGIKDGVDLAIKQANSKGTVKGYTLKLDAEDDTGKADVGAQVASKLVSDSTVVGVVGPLNSSVGQTVAPVMAQAGLTVISPANSGIALTGRDALASGGTQTRKYKSYFRVVATDDIQGPFAARFAVQTLGKKKLAIVHDKKAYGQGLAEAFAAEAKKDGATVLPTETINPGDKDFSGVVTKIAQQKPDFLYYGGEYPEASLLTKQMKSGGLNVPLMGGDGVYSPTYISNGGASANGDYATSLGAPTDALASAKQFVADYKAGGYNPGERDPYAAYAYDSANAIIQSLAKAVAGGASGDALRAQVLAGVQSVSLQGATGPISFDQFGDTNAKVLTVYEVKNGAFVAVKTDTFK